MLCVYTRADLMTLFRDSAASLRAWSAMRRGLTWAAGFFSRSLHVEALGSPLSVLVACVRMRGELEVPNVLYLKVASMKFTKCICGPRV